MNLGQRIRRDARLLAGDAEAAALLACLSEHIFGPNLDATFLARASGASREARHRLAAAVGPLKSYVTELRMTEAARLVRDTDLLFPEIGKRLGYLVLRTFRRAFKETHHVSLGEMRQQARTEQAPDPVSASQLRRLTPRAESPYSPRESDDESTRRHSTEESSKDSDSRSSTVERH